MKYDKTTSIDGRDMNRRSARWLVMISLFAILVLSISRPAWAQTALPTPTRTETPTYTETPTRTATVTRTATATLTETPTPTFTLTPTITPTLVPSQTATPTMTLTLAQSLTPTHTATLPLKISDPCLKVDVVNAAALSMGWDEQGVTDCSLPVADIFHTVNLGVCSLNQNVKHEENKIVLIHDIDLSESYPPVKQLPDSILKQVPFHGMEAYLYIYDIVDTNSKGAALFWRFGNFGMQAWHQIDCIEEAEKIDVFPSAEVLYQVAVIHGLGLDTGLCDDVICEPYCQDGTYYSYGSCDAANGECLYSAEPCEYGCDDSGMVCAGPPPTATPISWDLSINRMELIQAVNGGLPVAWKPAVLWLSFNWTDPTSDILVDATLHIDEEILQTEQILVKSEYTQDELNEGKNILLLHLPPDRLSPGAHTILVQAEIRPSSDQVNFIDTNLANNIGVAENSFFTETDELTFLMQPIDSVDNQSLWLYLIRAYPFLSNVLPVSNINILPFFPMEREVLDENAASQITNLAIKRYLYNSQASSDRFTADFSVGIHPDDFYGDKEYGTQYGWENGAALVGIGNKRARAHETLARIVGHDLLQKDLNVDAAPDYIIPISQDALLYKGQQGVFEDLGVTNAKYLNFMSMQTGGDIKTWVNSDTWNQLVSELSIESAVQNTSSGLNSLNRFSEENVFPGMLVAGTIGSDGVVSVDTLLWLDRLTSTYVSSQYEFSFQTVGSQGEVLETVPLYIDFSVSDPAPFVVTIPANDMKVAGLQLMYANQAIWQRQPSANAPSISLHTPEEISIEKETANEADEQAEHEYISMVENTTITWQAEDFDGDDLKYYVLYSPDGGSTWLPLAVDLSESEYFFQADNLPGASDCRLRVFASDGWHTSISDSENGFSVKDKTPGITILSPRDESEFNESESVIFQALAYDAEEGILNGSNIAWYSNRDGLIGSGGRLQMDSLSTGKHTIRALAIDRSGNQTEISIDLTIIARPGSDEGQFYVDERWGWATLCCLFGAGLFILILGILYVRLFITKPKSANDNEITLPK